MTRIINNPTIRMSDKQSFQERSHAKTQHENSYSEGSRRKIYDNGQVPHYLMNKCRKDFHDASYYDKTINPEDGTFQSDTFLSVLSSKNNQEFKRKIAIGSAEDIKMNGRFRVAPRRAKKEWVKFKQYVRQTYPNFKRGSLTEEERKRYESYTRKETSTNVGWIASIPSILDKSGKLRQGVTRNMIGRSKDETLKLLRKHHVATTLNENGEVVEEQETSVQSSGITNNNKETSRDTRAKGVDGTKIDDEGFVPEVFNIPTGNVLRELRNSTKKVKDGLETVMTQEELAKKLNIQLTSLAAMERGDGTVPLTPSLKKKLSVIFGKSFAFHKL
jgi:DNA-binding XRE family transcriptional regulator